MALEVAIYRLQPTVTHADFLAASDEITALLKTQEGFVNRTIGQAEGGEWLDILTWKSVEAAKAALAAFQNDPVGRRFLGYLDPQQIQIFYLETVTSQQ
jgi:hypothetical protein